MKEEVIKEFERLHSSYYQKSLPSKEEPKPYKMRNGDVYNNENEALDAYGCGMLTRKQYEKICDYFRKKDNDKDISFNKEMADVLFDMTLSMKEGGEATPESLLLSYLIKLLDIHYINSDGLKIAVRSNGQENYFNVDSSISELIINKIPKRP